MATESIEVFAVGAQVAGIIVNAADEAGALQTVIRAWLLPVLGDVLLLGPAPAVEGRPNDRTVT